MYILTVQVWLSVFHKYVLCSQWRTNQTLGGQSHSVCLPSLPMLLDIPEAAVLQCYTRMQNGSREVVTMTLKEASALSPQPEEACCHLLISLARTAFSSKKKKKTCFFPDTGHYFSVAPSGREVVNCQILGVTMFKWAQIGSLSQAASLQCGWTPPGDSRLSFISHRTCRSCSVPLAVASCDIAQNMRPLCYPCAASPLTPAFVWIIMSFSSLLFSLKSYCLELEKRLSCASLYSVQWTRNSFFRFLLSLITKSLGLPVGLVSQFLFPVCDDWILYLVRVCLCFAYL